MGRYFMRLSYNGANFHGWQSQPNAVSVQSTIEGALAKVFRNPVKITGAGRTDAGVNARIMVAHLDLSDDCKIDCDRLVAGLNALCGNDIAIEGLWRVHDGAHARFDAVSRTYHYYTHIGKSPFLSPFSWQEPQQPLDFDKMNECGRLLTEVSDFTSFAKLHTDVKTNICKVTEARWEELENDRHRFIISADRFLRNMVRAVVGTLVDVGRGKMDVDEFLSVIAAKNRCAAGTSMPPNPLFLWDISYPYDYSLD